MAQFPNAPLLVAFAGWGLAKAAEGELHDVGRAVFHTGLAVWAWLELTEGANLFRRGLGAGGLVYVVAELT